jgi:hypothetical protein
MKTTHNDFSTAVEYAAMLLEQLGAGGPLPAELLRHLELATARLTADKEVAEAAEVLVRAVDEYTIEVGKVERGESDFADQGKLYECREAVDVALRAWHEATGEGAE